MNKWIFSVIIHKWHSLAIDTKSIRHEGYQWEQENSQLGLLFNLKHNHNTTAALDGTVTGCININKIHSMCGSFENFSSGFQIHICTIFFTLLTGAKVISSFLSFSLTHTTTSANAIPWPTSRNYCYLPACCRLASITYLIFKEAGFLSRLSTKHGSTNCVFIVRHTPSVCKRTAVDIKLLGQSHTEYTSSI